MEQTLGRSNTSPHHTKNKKYDLNLKVVTMIETVTLQSKITKYDNKSDISIADLVDTTQVDRSPGITEIMYGQGSEYISHEFIKYLIEEEYLLLARTCTSGNPTFNAILERIHAVEGNVFWTYNIKDTYMYKYDLCLGILVVAAFTIFSTSILKSIICW